MSRGLWGLDHVAVQNNLEGVTFSQDGDDHYAWHPSLRDDFAGMLHVNTDHMGQRYVDGIHVHPDLARRGIAHALWERAGRPLHDPKDQTPEGKAWAQSVGGDDRRYAGVNGDLPELRYEHSIGQKTQRHRLMGYDQDKRVGWLDWTPGGEVENIEIHPDYQRRGVGTEMWNRARVIDPGIQHSNAQTADGQAWAAHTAAVPEGYKVHLFQSRGDGGGVAGVYPAKAKPNGSNWHSALSWDADGKINNLDTKPEHQGKGLARGLYEHVRDNWRPDLMHDHALSEDGAGFANAVGGQMYDDAEYTRRREQRWQEQKLPYQERDQLRQERGYAPATEYRPPMRRRSGLNGDLPPMTMQPFYSRWHNGIMARHAEDGRPIGHLHWHPDGEIDTIRVHPDFRRRGVGNAMLDHARANPQDYPTKWGEIYHSNDLTPAGRAWANSDPTHQDPGDDQVNPSGGEETWGWKALQNYTPAHVPYTGQNEAELSEGLVPMPQPQPYKPSTPPKTAANQGGSDWPAAWGDDHPDVPWDKRWSPNHRNHVPAPFDE